jgi:hypothetical protein
LRAAFTHAQQVMGVELLGIYRGVLFYPLTLLLLLLRLLRLLRLLLPIHQL